MSLRSKVLSALLALTLIPLVGVGVVACIHAFEWSAESVDARLARTAERAAADVTAARSDLLESLGDLGTAVAAGGAEAPAAAAWEAAIAAWPGASRFARLELRDAEGEVVQRAEMHAPAPVCSTEPPGTLALSVRPVAGAGRYAVVGIVSTQEVLGSVPVAQGDGRVVIMDRASGARIFDAACQNGGPAIALPETLPLDRRGRMKLGSAAGDQPAWYVNLAQPAWTVVSLPAPGWPAPFSDARLTALLVVMALALVSGGAFVILIGYLRRSLDALTSAAVRIGQGDFAPWLPPPGEDEVGRLSLAIGAMAGRLREMIHQNARSRQMAAIGELASYVSHEIRNPLSSIKLNLQSVDRELRLGSVPADLPSVLLLCLKEVHRLDGTVQAVLRLAGARPPEFEPCRVSALLDEGLAAASPQLAERGIDVRIQYGAADEMILADPAQLRGVVLNLLSNAVQAMPEGGRVRVWTITSLGVRGPTIRIHIADDGSGVSPELRDRIFQPFFTTRVNGSGIGLPLALRTVEAHGGRLWLETRSELERGAEFVIQLPLASVEAATEAETEAAADQPHVPVMREMKRWPRPRVSEPVA
jgi:signal transduction histidine kinase